MKLRFLLAATCCLSLAPPPVHPPPDDDPGKPPGDDKLKDHPEAEAATPEQIQAVVDAVTKACGEEEGECFSEVVNGENCCLVDIDSKTGSSDASTIGLDLDNLSPLLLGVTAAHEKKHWERASEPRDKDGDGQDDQASPDDGDPLTAPDSDGDGAVDNPCGPLEHAKMGVRDMDKMRARLDCPGYTTDEDKKSACDPKSPNSWDKMKGRIQDATTDAKDLGCKEAESGVPNSRWGKSADQLAQEMGLDVSKPDICE